MKLRNKKTGEVREFNSVNVLKNSDCRLAEFVYHSLAELNQDWEDVGDINVTNIPLIKDEKIRKAVRAWAEANNFSAFRVNNQHFNYVKIHGVKDRYDPNGSNIEFMGTIAGVEKRTYEIDELCGEEEE